MRNTILHNGRNVFSFKERRLVYKVSTIEIAKGFVDRLQHSVPRTAEEMKNLLQSIDLHNLRNEFTESFGFVSPEKRKEISDKLIQFDRTLLSMETAEKLNTLNTLITSVRVDNVLNGKDINTKEPDDKKMLYAGLMGVTAVAVVVHGFQWFFGRAKKSTAAGKEAAGMSRGGFLRKLAVGLGVGLLAFGSYKAYELYKEMGSFKGMAAKMKEGFVQGVFDAGSKVKDSAAGIVSQSKEFLGMDTSVDKYNLSKDQYENGRKMYRQIKPLDEIKKEIFDLDPGQSSEDWELFYADIRTEFTPETDENSSVEYTPISASIDCYEAEAQHVCIRMMEWMDKNKVLTTLGAIGLARWGVLQRVFSGSISGLSRLGSAAGSMASMGLRDHKVVGFFALCGILATPKLVEASARNVRMPKNMSELLKACSFDSVPAIKGFALGADLASLSNDIARYGKMVGGIAGDIVDWAIDSASDLLGDGIDILASDDAEVIARNHANTFSALRRQLLHDESKLRKAGDVEETRQHLPLFDNARQALDAYQDMFFVYRTSEHPQQEPMLTAALKSLQSALNPLELVIAQRGDRLVWYDKFDPSNALDFGVEPGEADHDTILQISQTLDAGESMPDRLFSAAIQRFSMEQQDNVENYPDKSEWLAMIVGDLLYVLDPENRHQYYVVNFEAVQSLFSSDDSWGDWAATVGDSSMQTALMTLGPSLGVRLASRALGVVPLYGLKIQALRNFTPVLGQFDVLNEFRRLSGGGSNILKYGVLEGRKINTVLTQLRYEKDWFRTVAKTSNIDDLYHIASQAGIDLNHLKRSGASISVVRKELREGMVAAINGVERSSIFRRMNLWARIVRGERVTRVIRGGEEIFNTLSSSPTSFQVLYSALQKGVKTVEVTADAFAAFLKQLSVLRATINTSSAQLQAFILRHIALLQAAAPTSRSAAALLKVGKWLQVGGKFTSKALPVLGIIIDLALIGANELEIREAIAEGNTHKADALRGKRIALGASGAGGAAVLYINPITLGPAVAAIGAGMYSNAIYDSIVTWESTRDDWLEYSPEQLEEMLRDREIGHMDWWGANGAGHNMWWGLWRGARSWTASGRQINEKEDEDDFAIIEGVNEHVRQEMLAAYFLQTLRVPQPCSENETEEQRQQRLEDTETIVRDAMNYVRAMTRGSYDIGMHRMDRLTGGAQSYASLMKLRRAAQKNGEDLRVGYDWDGEKRELDLTTLDYVISSRYSDSSLVFQKTLRQYQEEYLLIQGALAEINGMDIFDDLASDSLAA